MACLKVSMDPAELADILDEEACVLERLGMVVEAAEMRLCTSLREAISLYQDTAALRSVMAAYGPRGRTPDR